MDIRQTKDIKFDLFGQCVEVAGFFSSLHFQPFQWVYPKC